MESKLIRVPLTCISVLLFPTLVGLEGPTTSNSRRSPNEVFWGSVRAKTERRTGQHFPFAITLNRTYIAIRPPIWTPNLRGLLQRAGVSAITSLQDLGLTLKGRSIIDDLSGSTIEGSWMSVLKDSQPPLDQMISICIEIPWSHVGGSRLAFPTLEAHIKFHHSSWPNNLEIPSFAYQLNSS